MHPFLGVMGSMKILVCSYHYAPEVGAIPTVTRLLAQEYARAGHQVTVLTHIPAPPDFDLNAPYRVVRRTSFFHAVLLGIQADVVHFNNISLRFLIPLALLFKPIFVTHQEWLARYHGGIGWQDRIKRLILRLVHNVAVSEPVARLLPARSHLIGNPFDRASFLPWHDMVRDRDIVYIGRLTTEKGCDIALRAIGQLAGQGIYATVTILGDGPEREYLEALAASMAIADQVQFLGLVTENLGQILARHKVMVIPSRRSEPFGIVALEGIAAGCAIVASSSGGLPEAVGPCGLLFPAGNVAALAAALKQALADDKTRAALVAAGPAHLEQFAPAVIAAKYLELFESAVK